MVMLKKLPWHYGEYKTGNYCILKGQFGLGQKNFHSIVTWRSLLLARLNIRLNILQLFEVSLFDVLEGSGKKKL